MFAKLPVFKGNHHGGAVFCLACTSLSEEIAVPSLLWLLSCVELPIPLEKAVFLARALVRA